MLKRELSPFISGNFLFYKFKLFRILILNPFSKKKYFENIINNTGLLS